MLLGDEIESYENCRMNGAVRLSVMMGIRLLVKTLVHRLTTVLKPRHLRLRNIVLLMVILIYFQQSLNLQMLSLVLINRFLHKRWRFLGWSSRTNLILSVRVLDV